MSQEYSTFDIVKGLGIPRERLREWIDKKFIKPSIAKAKGAGTKALFSRFDLYIIATFKQLVDETGLNLPRAKAADILEKWKAEVSRLVSELDDKQLQRAMARCEIMTIEQRGSEFRLFFTKAWMEIMRQTLLAKFPDDYVYKELSKFEGMGNTIYSPTKKNALQDWEWGCVLHINFIKIAAAVDAAFPC